MSCMPDMQDATLAIRVLATRADTNQAGDIFGGWLMSQVDIAGSIVAIQAARGRIATVAVSEFRFLKPVYIGDLMSCYAKVVATGNTSITVEIESWVARSRDPSQCEKVAIATLVYVALDESGEKRSLS